MELALRLIHGLDYLLCAALVGVLSFRALIAPAGRIRPLAIAAAATSALWLVLVAADMADSWSAADLVSVATGTTFGHLTLARFALCVAIGAAGPIAAKRAVCWVALILPLLFSLTSHSAAAEHAAGPGIAADFLHFAAIGIWTGGLAALAAWLASWRRNPGAASAGTAVRVVTRFSHFAIASTALILATGLALALRMGVRPAAPLATLYGALVVVKLALFLATLGAASINQFVHLRRASSIPEPEFASGVLREVRIELAIVTAIFFVAGVLTRLPTPSG